MDLILCPIRSNMSSSASLVVTTSIMVCPLKGLGRILSQHRPPRSALCPYVRGWPIFEAEVLGRQSSYVGDAPLHPGDPVSTLPVHGDVDGCLYGEFWSVNIRIHPIGAEPGPPSQNPQIQVSGMNDGESDVLMAAGDGHERVRRRLVRLHGLHGLAVAESPLFDSVQGRALEDSDLRSPADVEGRIELLSIGGLREFILKKGHVDKRAAV